jgi:hypothetical protein
MSCDRVRVVADAAELGRVATRSPEARAKRVAARRRHAQACSAWDASSQPAWLTAEVVFREASAAACRNVGLSDCLPD